WFSDDRERQAHLLTVTEVVDLEVGGRLEALERLISFPFLLDGLAVHLRHHVARLESHPPEPLDVIDADDAEADELSLLELRFDLEILKESPEPRVDHGDHIGSRELSHRRRHRLSGGIARRRRALDAGRLGALGLPTTGAQGETKKSKSPGNELREGSMRHRTETNAEGPSRATLALQNRSPSSGRALAQADDALNMSQELRRDVFHAALPAEVHDGALGKETLRVQVERNQTA